MSAVSLLNVRLATVPVFQTFPVPLSVHNPEPIVMVRVLLFEELNVKDVTLKLFALNVPRVSVVELEDRYASPSSNAPAALSTVIGNVIVLPAEVRV